MDSEFRQLDARERGILEKLLEAGFPGHEELRAQLSSLTVKQIDEDGTLKLMCNSGTPSPQNNGLAIEGIFKDEDGGTISILLHVNREGYMHMLEVLKIDGTSIINKPSAKGMVLRLPVKRERVPGEAPELPLFQVKSRAVGGPTPDDDSEAR